MIFNFISSLNNVDTIIIYIDSSTLEASQDNSNKNDMLKEKAFEEYISVPKLTPPIVYMDYGKVFVHDSE